MCLEMKNVLLVVVSSWAVSAVLCDNACASQPCQNNGTCTNIDFLNSYKCKCKQDFYGDNCEKVSPCVTNPSVCRNNGTCKSVSYLLVGYRCSCRTGFGGYNCEKESNCKPGVCLNGGTCHDIWWMSKYYGCACPKHVSGKRCEKVHPCYSSPCKNGGKCRSGYDGYYCSCGDMYWGDHCQHESECHTKVCHNGGRCSSSSNGEGYCHCAQGFRGATCRHRSCPVEASFCKYSTNSSLSHSRVYEECVAGFKAREPELKECARKHYENLLNSTSCDCLPSDVAFDYSKFVNVDFYYDSVEGQCLSLADRDVGMCSWETWLCSWLLTRAIANQLHAERCPNTTRDHVVRCAQKYREGKLDTEGCKLTQAAFQLAEPEFDDRVPLMCTGCSLIELYGQCSYSPYYSEDTPQRICQLLTSADQMTNLTQCVRSQAEQGDDCTSVVNHVMAIHERHFRQVRERYGQYCQKVAEYKKLWTEEWGCHGDPEMKRSDL